MKQNVSCLFCFCFIVVVSTLKNENENFNINDGDCDHPATITTRQVGTQVELKLNGNTDKNCYDKDECKHDMNKKQNYVRKAGKGHSPPTIIESMKCARIGM